MMDYIVHNLFSTEAGVVWLVLKWILVVLAAGFIGQFGKAFATHLIQRARERKKKDAVPAGGGPVTGNAPGAVPAATEAARLRETQESESEAREQEGKKARKEQAKIRKKTLKGLKKLFK